MILKINYYSINGCYQVTETVDDNLGMEIEKIIEEFDRKERDYERKRRYNHVLSMDGMKYDDIASQEDPVSYLLDRQETERIFHAIEMLPEVQKRRLKLMLQGKKYREIADIEGVSVAAVGESIKAAQKALIKFLQA